MRHASRPTVWARVVAAFVNRARGVDRSALLQSVGLAEEDLRDPDSRLPLETLYTLLESITALSGDRFALVELTRTLEIDALDALAFVVMTSPTLGAGLRAMLRYQRVLLEGEHYEMESNAEWTRIVYQPWGPPRLAHELMAEMFAADLMTNASAMTGAPFGRARVELTHRVPDADRLAALLGDPELRFDRAQSSVWLRTSDLERRVAPDGQAALCAYFARHLEEKLREAPATSLVGRVRDRLLQARESEPSVTSIARQLRMSARTLQRRLADEGTSLRSLVRETRRARAIELLESGASIAEVAYVLGYAEPSAFHRAFRRWTRRTPESFRRDQSS
jgi:AraC-like DNA-binding protein